MKKSYLIIVFVFCLVNTKCTETEKPVIDKDNLIIGDWIEPIYNNDEITFKRSASLLAESYGISFKQNSDFVERSSGWCGTPPLTFFDSNGVWKLEDELISVALDYYPNSYFWRIVSISEETLVIKREITEQEQDHRDLMDLFNEMYSLSTSVSCVHPNNWTIVAYGAKACGGPQGFVAYSNEIDVEAFLVKVEAYTNAEKAYNIKWGVVSTCDLPQQPKSVNCINGFPILIY
ncbi:hypothetical protein N1F78_08995 [Seonamhaeicola sp. MEBiC1930]|uniref:hypothetical protein n=1 Tax=Seonamhaeicola sp. MEBiC01930 TaxID=2976768 RepID=UPI0032475EED